MTREELESLNVEESAIDKIIEASEQEKFESEISSKLKVSRAKNEKAVKALIDFKGEKNVDEQLEYLKKEHSYLFEQDEIRVNSGVEHKAAIKKDEILFSFNRLRT